MKIGCVRIVTNLCKAYGYASEKSCSPYLSCVKNLTFPLLLDSLLTRLYTAFFGIFNLLVRIFSTESTRPIIITTRINKLIVIKELA